MKDIYKNPIFYFILVPVLMGLWPLLIKTVYLPKAQDNWTAETKQYNDAQVLIEQILELDPERLDYADALTNSVEFDYATAVDKIAGLCDISAANYELSSKPVRSSGQQKTQDCKIVLKKVGVEKFARFLSTIQLRWANLQCTTLTLTKTKGLPDDWKAAIDFKYYY